MISQSEVISSHGKTGVGVPDILTAIVDRINPPDGDPNKPLQAMIFDSEFNPFRGVIAYFRVKNGTLRKDEHVRFVNTGKNYHADEIGILKLKQEPVKEISAGNVGYIISGIKAASEIKVGDTITKVDNPCASAIKGFEDVKPIYEMMQQQLAPLGLTFDLAEIEKARPVIAMMLE